MSLNNAPGPSRVRVGIDGRVFQSRRAGVGRYVFELCRALDSEMPDAEFFVYSHIPVELPVASSRWTLRCEPHALLKRMKSFLWLKLRVGGLCARDGVNAFWGSGSFLPILPRGVRRVLTVYDLNYKIVPETMLPAAVWQYKLFFARDVRQADYVLAISDGTSRRLKETTGRGADAIVYPGVGAEFSRQDAGAIAACLSRLGIAQPYILAVATWEPRKNLETLVKAFLDLKARGELKSHKLVLVGGRGWKDKALAQHVGQATRQDVLSVGYIKDSELALLYAGADVFVFPSLYEGFGMPAAEARACGTPVVATDIPEIREAGGPSGIYVPPTVEGIRSGLQEALARGYSDIERDGLPSWSNGAKVLAAALAGTLKTTQ